MKSSFNPKSLIYLALLLGGIGLFARSSSPAGEPVNLPKNNSILADTFLLDIFASTGIDVTFGRGPSCIGRGVCSVTETSGMGTPGGDASGSIWLDSGGALQMRISKNTITVQQKELQFVEGSFEVTDAYTLSSGLSSAIGAENPITIATGSYNVQESANDFTIGF